MKKKTIALVLACIVCVGIGVSGTLAWLTATSGEVKNTFSTSDIDITLTETTGSSYQMVPGYTISKDPKVTVKAGSEACYVFVKLEKSDNYDTFLEEPVVRSPWKQLKNGDVVVEGVYYIEELTTTVSSDTSYYVLAGGTATGFENGMVTVKGEGVTKKMMNDLAQATYPTLTVTAYASQMYKNNTEKFEPYEAWQNAQPTTTPGT